MTQVLEKYAEQNCWNTHKREMNIIINFDIITGINKKKHDTNQPSTPDHPYRILTAGGFVSGNTNALLDLINCQPNIDRIFFDAKDPYERKQQPTVSKRENVDLKYFKDRESCVKYLSDMNGVYKNTEEYNLGNKRKYWQHLII